MSVINHSSGNTNVSTTADTTLLYTTHFKGGTEYHFTGYWPGGSRGGPAVSRLDGFADALIGWGSLTDMDCTSYNDNRIDTHETDGINQLSYHVVNSLSEYDRNECFGYRFGLRQPYNRPRWSVYTRGFLELYPYTIVFNSDAVADYHTHYIIIESTINKIKRKFVFENSATYSNGATKDADARVPEVWVRIHGLTTNEQIKQAFEAALAAENARLSDGSEKEIFSVRPSYVAGAEHYLHIDNVATASTDEPTHIRQFKYTDTLSPSLGLSDNDYQIHYTHGVIGPFTHVPTTTPTNTNRPVSYTHLTLPTINSV